jgi:pre-mRNA branch site protein p14
MNNNTSSTLPPPNQIPKNLPRKLRLAPEINRFIYVKNLPYKITSDELYDIFSKFGPVRQIRRGCKSDNKGTAFVVYEDIFDAKKAVERLSSVNVGGRYLICLYYHPKKTSLHSGQ